MKNVLILEDNAEMRDTVEKILNEIDETLIIYKTSTLPDAYQAAIEHTISLFIVDIMLDRSAQNDVSGLLYVEKIRAVEKYAFVPIVFITSLVDPELHAYRKLHCYAYLEKPLLVDEAKEILSQALRFEQPKKEEGSVFFRKDGLIYAVDKKEIVYIQSHGGKVTIRTVRDEMTLYYRNCKQMLQALDSDKFIQSSRGTIVNRDFIQHIDPVNRIVHLSENYGIIEIGTMMKKSFMDKMKND